MTSTQKDRAAELISKAIQYAIIITVFSLFLTALFLLLATFTPNP